MLIYAVLIGLIIAGQFLVWSKLVSGKRYCIFICVCMILIAGLRDRNLGLYDMVTGYLPGWHMVQNLSWTEIIRKSLTGKTALKDIGYAGVTKILSYGTKSDQWFIFFTSVPYLVVSTVFIYRHSRIYGLSFLLFVGLNYFTSAYYLVHHIWATVFLLIAVEELLKDRVRYFVLFTLIACLFHASAFIFLLLLIRYQSRMHLFHFLLLTGSVIIGLFGKKPILFLLSLFIEKSSRWYFYLSNLKSDSLTRWFLAFACLLCAIVYEKKMLARDKDNAVLIDMGVWCCVFYAFTPIISELHRFARFFGIADVLLVSNALYESGSTRKRLLLFLMITVIFCIYLFGFLFWELHAAPYHFFWE